MIRSLIDELNGPEILAKFGWLKDVQPEHNETSFLAPKSRISFGAAATIASQPQARVADVIGLQTPPSVSGHYCSADMILLGYFYEPPVWWLLTNLNNPFFE